MVLLTRWKTQVNKIVACIVAIVVSGGCACVGVQPWTGRKDVGERPLVGAIRWDGWNQWAHYEKCFDPLEWRSRLPFFATITPDNKARLRGDSQEVMDREIAYAKAAGLDYWAFVWYHPEGWPPASAEMEKCFQLYLTSKHKADIHYAMILSGGLHLGPRDQLPQTLDALARHFAEPNYQKVMGNRPLVFFFEIADFVTLAGSEDAARGLLEDLRQKTIAAGAGNPYFVVMAFWPPAGAEQMDRLGCDAIGSYTAHCLGQTMANREFAYSVLADHNRTFWENAKGTGKEFIPTMNTGWDFRPMKRPEYPNRDPEDDWYQQPTPQELAGHLKSAMAWVETNPATCPAKTILIYAWNELAEGGWLVPTLSEGTARLDALAEVLREDR